MSQETQRWSADARGLKFAIVVARFNSAITGALLTGAKEALEGAGAAGFDVFHVPGSFELPLAAKLLAERRTYDAIVALGAVIRGETPHFDFVAAEAARGLQQVTLETGVPIAFGVLTTDTVEQAESRAGGKRGNKGHDAAMTAIEMACFARDVACGPRP
ncbi:MAG TPA: 6,7-dimethyl-8-ribityllumazine synthase [Bryobacteraceae bacterium]|jgi:6,7-dimethyl-8-ribityllumazine synthase